MRLPVAVVTFLLATTAVVRSAPAAERVAIAVFTVSGQPLVEEAKDKLRASLRGGLAAAGFDVVPQAEVDKAVSAGGLAGCDTMSCLRRIGELVMARRVVKATVEVIGNTHVVSALELIELSDGRTVANAKDDCDVCTMKEVNDGLSNAAASLRMQLEAPSVAPPGPSAPAVATPPPPPSKRPLWLGLTGVAAAALAGGAVSLGVSAFYHHKAHCGSLPTGEHCAYSYNGTVGIALGAVGIAAGLGAGGYFLYRALKSPSKYVTLVPALDGHSAALDVVGAW